MDAPPAPPLSDNKKCSGLAGYAIRPEGGWGAELLGINSKKVGAATRLLMSDSPDEMTIKQLVLRALAASTEFTQLGATPAQIREFISNAYGREIDRASLAPQLSRLRDEGLVEQVSEEGGKWKWRLTQYGVTDNTLQEIQELVRKK